MDAQNRIEQFKKMAEADPENELGHFSLGSAYLEAGQLDVAVSSLTRALELNPKLSKVYQLLGEAYQKSGNRADAVEVVRRGTKVADAQGDRMPLDAMVAMLREWGETVPELGQPKVAEDVADTSDGGNFRCARCGSPKQQLPKPPFKGALGAKVLANTCDACWREWIQMGTKVINELGLALSTEEGQQSYDQYMVEFLQLGPVSP